MKQTLKNSNILQSYAYVCRAQTNLRFGEKIAAQREIALQTVKRAYQEQFNLDLDTLHLQKLSTGKFVCDKYYFSISHSGQYVAVAVSTKPVGIDIQRFSGAKIHDIAKKVFTEKELSQFQNAPNQTDEFYFTWCKKEALWKSLDVQPPTVANIETVNVPFTTQKLELDGEAYYLAVTGNAVVLQ